MSELEIALTVVGGALLLFVLYLLYIIIALHFMGKKFRKLVEWMGLDRDWKVDL